VYLNELDQYAKRVLKCHACIRYVDDILLFADEKPELHTWLKQITGYLQNIRLRLHENSAQPGQTKDGVPFLGFLVFPDHRRLKRSNGIAFQRRFRKLISQYSNGGISFRDMSQRVQSWVNHASYGDTLGLRTKILGTRIG